MRNNKESLKIIPQEKPKMPFFLRGLLTFFLISILALTVIHFILKAQAGGLKLEEARLNQEIAELKEKQVEVIRKEIGSFAKRLSDFKLLLVNRGLALPVFDLVRAICHPKTQFLAFSFNQEDSKLHLEAKTESFKTLSQQVQIFGFDLEGWTEKPIAQAEASGISLTEEGSVEFNLSLDVNPAVLKLILEQ